MPVYLLHSSGRTLPISTTLKFSPFYCEKLRSDTASLYIHQCFELLLSGLLGRVVFPNVITYLLTYCLLVHQKLHADDSL